MPSKTKTTTDFWYERYALHSKPAVDDQTFLDDAISTHNLAIAEHIASKTLLVTGIAAAGLALSLAVAEAATARAAMVAAEWAWKMALRFAPYLADSRAQVVATTIATYTGLKAVEDAADTAYQAAKDKLSGWIDEYHQLQQDKADLVATWKPIIAREFREARLAADADTLAYAKSADPLLLDLDGGGVALVGLEDSTAEFAWHADAPATRTGWMGEGTGMLVTLAADGRPLPFTESAAFGDGLDRLASLDANRDGRIDAADAGFAVLRVWQDGDGDGAVDPGEIRSLDERGIAGLDLAAETASEMRDGNTVTRIGSFTLADGTVREMVDAWFARAPAAAAILLPEAGGSIALGGAAATVLGGSGPDAVTFGAGLATVTGGEGGGNSFIFVKGSIAAAVGGQVDRVTDFHLAGAGTADRSDQVVLRGFSAEARLVFDRDLDSGRHLYRVVDGDYVAAIELDHAGSGAAPAQAAWLVIA
ncbi:hypothetical protein ACFQS7_11135 [Dankookia sp. GCM10030260]|uniref:hypothetical protein n=1 Tax=Dankookia sp. GCM10030260 TaxID=3273390 RepID=UPI00360700DF